MEGKPPLRYLQTNNMFNSLSDFSETHFDSVNNILTYSTHYRDRVVSIGVDNKYGGYIVCVNNPNYQVDTTSDSPVWEYTSWDSTLLLDSCTESLETALETANRYSTIKNLPTIHPEYLPISNI